jgi:hypothetical protein
LSEVAIKTFLALLLLVSTSCFADEIVLHLASWHPTVQGYNQINPGLGYRMGLSDHNFISAGTYKNSINNQAIYVGIGKKLFSYRNATFTIAAGLVTGYAVNVMPFLVPEASFNLVKNIDFAINYFPKFPRSFSSAFAFSLQFKIP